VYDNIHDADMRLTGTIIRFDKQPCSVLRCFEHLKRLYVCLRDCVTDSEIKVALDNPKLDISSPPLGFIRYLSPYGPSYIYAARMPARRQRQGLDPSRLHYYNPITRSSTRIIATMGQLGDCIMGKFNQPDREYNSIVVGDKDSRCVVAFSRELAASLTNLYYKTACIGEITHEDGVHNVTITSYSFSFYPFKGVFNESWRFNKA